MTQKRSAKDRTAAESDEIEVGKADFRGGEIPWDLLFTLWDSGSQSLYIQAILCYNDQK